MSDFYIFGRRDGFNSASTLEDVGNFLSGTAIDLFPELAGTESLEVVSSSASDAAAGTGTRTIQVVYMDPVSQAMVTSAPITMNGTTAVALPFKAAFIYWTEAITGGTSEASAGTITLRIAGAGATQDLIPAGGNKSMAARFWIPANTLGIVTYWQASALGGTNQDAFLRVTTLFDRTLTNRYQLKDNSFVASGQIYQNNLANLVLPALAKIKISTLPSATTGRIDASFAVSLRPVGSIGPF